MVSKIVEIKGLKVEVENYDTKLNIVEYEGKFTSVDLPSLEAQSNAQNAITRLVFKMKLQYVETVQLSQ